MSEHKSIFIENPETHRMIRIGGRIWLKLVRRGVIDRGDYLPPNCAYRLKKEEYENDEEALQVLKAEKNRIIKDKEAPIGQKPVIYKKNQIVYQSDTRTDSARLTSDAALDVIDQIQNGDIDIPTDMNRDEARDYLQGLIFSQMLSKKKKFKNPKLKPALKKPALKKPALKKTRNLTSVPLFKRPVNKRMVVKMHKPILQDENEDESEYEYSYQYVDEDSNFDNRNLEEEPETEYEYVDEEPEEIEEPETEYEEEIYYEE